MRKLLAGVTAACALALPAGPAAQDRDAQPTFQSRVDLVTIDVAALDGQGNPVPDLRPDDFTVKVDGKSRRVVAADFVRITPGGAVPASVPAAVDAPITTNAAVRTERRIVIAVDQTLIRPAGITPLLRTAARFVDGLSPGDYAGFVAFPEPGPRVELTLDKTRAVRGHRHQRQGADVLHQPGFARSDLAESRPVVPARPRARLPGSDDRRVDAG
jgi:hypothetical protein